MVHADPIITTDLFAPVRNNERNTDMRQPLAWRIDTWPDVEGEPIEPKGTVIVGPSDAPRDLLNRLAKQEGQRFRMFDDDGLLYCKGRILYSNPDDVGGGDDFAPLDDYGMPGLGCTRIDYWEKDADTGTYSWQQL